MFVALRDLRAAKGRFALIAVVVVLVALLVSFLSGLTAGLRHQNISAIQSISADRLVFADTGSGPSFDESTVTPDQVDAWSLAAESVEPIGISRGKAGVGEGPQTTVSLFGADGATGAQRLPAPGTVVLSDGAAEELGAAAGQTVSIGDTRFTVAAVDGDPWYSPLPAGWMSLSDWRIENPRGGEATVLAVSGVDDAGAADAAAGTLSASVAESYEAISSYKSENASLTMMTSMLFAISALVIGAFFTVWTIQRTPDIATLKALGATTGSLARDALGQALILSVAGVGIGIGLTAAMGTVLGDAVPFVLDVSTTLIPGAALVGLGLLGAAFALRFLSTTDPLTALGSAR